MEVGNIKVPEGMQLNSNKEIVKKIINKLADNEGYCPCMQIKNNDTLCPCKYARGEMKACRCGLFIPINKKWE